MEDKLAAYRARKAKENGSTGGWFPKGKDVTKRNMEKDSSSSQSSTSSKESELESLLRNSDEGQNSQEVGHTSTINQTVTRTHSRLYLAIKIVLWSALFGLFAVCGFGAIFVILSLFYVIYANMRTSKKAPGEKSAYSVFNPECERIHGTLTAEEIERGMLYGIGGAMR